MLEHIAVFTVALVGYAVLGRVLLSMAPEAARVPLTVVVLVGGLLVAFAVHVVHGAGGARFATEAERHSSRALRRLDGWRVVDDVPFGSMNIDHVAVGERGVIAVETTFLPPVAAVGDDGEDPFELALRRARKGARRVKLLLKSARMDATVEAALAVWGRGSITVPQAATDGVTILVGNQQRQWREQLPDTGERLSEEQVTAIEAALKRFVEMRLDAERGEGSLSA